MFSGFGIFLLNVGMLPRVHDVLGVQVDHLLEADRVHVNLLLLVRVGFAQVYEGYKTKQF